METNLFKEGWTYDRDDSLPKPRRKSAPLAAHGRLYVALLEDSRLSSKARFCHGVMMSFGPESRASVPAIARRMGVVENTVRRAQKELEITGWIKFLHQDVWGLKHWALLGPGKDSGTGPPPKHPPPSNGEGVGVQPSKAKQEHNQEAKQELKDPSALGAGEALERYQERYLAFTGKTYKQNPRDQAAAKLLFKAHRITLKELDYAISNFLSRDRKFTGYAAAALFNQFNAYEHGAFDGGGDHKRKGHVENGNQPGQGGGVHAGRQGEAGGAGGARRRRNDPPLD